MYRSVFDAVFFNRKVRLPSTIWQTIIKIHVTDLCKNRSEVRSFSWQDSRQSTSICPVENGQVEKDEHTNGKFLNTLFPAFSTLWSARLKIVERDTCFDKAIISAQQSAQLDLRSVCFCEKKVELASHMKWADEVRNVPCLRSAGGVTSRRDAGSPLRAFRLVSKELFLGV